MELSADQQREFISGDGDEIVAVLSGGLSPVAESTLLTNMNKSGVCNKNFWSLLDDDEEQPMQVKSVVHAVGSADPKQGPVKFICRRCSIPKDFSAHAVGCRQHMTFTSFVECPRCAAIMTTKTQARNHSGLCFANDPKLSSRDKRVQCHPADRLQRVDTPINLLKCRYCRTWRHHDVRMLQIHEVLCYGLEFKIPAPVLPPKDVLYTRGDFELTVPLARSLVRAFKSSNMLKNSQRLRWLSQHSLAVATLPATQTTEKVLVRPGVLGSVSMTELSGSASMSVVSGAVDQPLTSVNVALPSTESPVGNKSPFHPAKCKLKTPPRQVEPEIPADSENWRFVPTVERGRVSIPKSRAARRSRAYRMAGPDARILWHDRPDRPEYLGLGPNNIEAETATSVKIHGGYYVKDVPATAFVTPQLQRTSNLSTTTPAPPPTETVVVKAPADRPKPVADAVLRRDRFKIMINNYLWVDSYGRSTSPRRDHLIHIAKPDPNMTGSFLSNAEFTPPLTVAVTGHVPSGWGVIHSEDGLKFDFYKSTPGDPAMVPEAAQNMRYYVPLFLAPLPDGSRPAVGTLHTTCNLRAYATVRYFSAGIDGRLVMQP